MHKNICIKNVITNEIIRDEVGNPQTFQNETEAFNFQSQSSLNLLDYEIRRLGDFPLHSDSSSKKEEPNEEIPPTALVRKIKNWSGHILFHGEQQAGKLIQAIYAVQHLTHNKKTAVIMLFRNITDDMKQWSFRVESHSNEQAKNGLCVIDAGTPITSYCKDDSLLSLANKIRSGGVLIGLANPTTLKRLNKCFKTFPDLKGRAALVLDEADLAVYELEPESVRIQTEEELALLYPQLMVMISITATPLAITLCDKLTEAYTLDIPPSWTLNGKKVSYFGFNELTNVPVIPVHNRGGYDPLMDSKNLDQFCTSFYEQKEAMALISVSKRVKDHRSIIRYLATSSNTSGCSKAFNTTYLMFNGKRVRVFDCNDTEVPPTYSTISEAIEAYKTCSHIVIVSGIKAGRGISFVSTNYERHLTHQYIAAAPSTHLELLTQTVRLVGVYSDQPTLYLFCAKDVWEQILVYVEYNKELTQMINAARTTNQSLGAVIDLTTEFKLKLTSDRKLSGLAYNVDGTSRARTNTAVLKAGV